MAEAQEPETLVAAGLRALLEDIVDYAGIFPPASLTLREAIENYARYRSARDAWMLGRFVVPAARLTDLAAHATLFERNPPFRFSVLAGQSDDAATFAASLQFDLRLTAAFRERHGDLVRIEAIEMRTPSDSLQTDVVTVGRFISDVDAVLDRHGAERADLFFEIPLDLNCRQSASILAGALSSRNRNRTLDEQGVAGIKMRTGGTKAESFPHAERVALVIATCRDAGIPFKATAGLHHPVRHFDEGVSATMHGFINVFVAAVLAASEEGSDSDILSILLEEDASAFEFTDEGIEWKGRRASVDEVAKTRRDRAVSFGSCSFTEPLEDLRALGFI